MMTIEMFADDVEKLERRYAASPDNLEVIVALANAYANQGRWAEAVKAYKAAIAIDPQNGDLYNRMGVVYVALDEPTSAEEYYLKAIENAPEESKPYFNLGELYQKQRRWSNAKYLFEKCLQLSNDPDERAEVRLKIVSM